jgi:hypothetical protein
MKGFTRRAVTMWSLALAVAAAAAIIAVVNSGSSNASAVSHQAAPLARANLTRGVWAAVAKTARANGVDPNNVVELGGTGSGSQRHAVLSGKDASGATVFSVLSGFGMSDFVPGDRFVDSNHPMFVSDSVEGPSTDARIVGIVGIATRTVESVTLDLANGTTTTLAVTRAPGIPYDGFSYVSNNRATFPVKVTAYSAGGRVLAEHEVDAKPLCSEKQPECAAALGLG